MKQGDIFLQRLEQAANRKIKLRNKAKAEGEEGVSSEDIEAARKYLDNAPVNTEFRTDID